MQRTQRILNYLPALLAYFALSVPSGLGIYWVTNNLLSTLSTVGIRQYFKSNPNAGFDIDIEKMSRKLFTVNANPIWGYRYIKSCIQLISYESTPMHTLSDLRNRSPPFVFKATCPIYFSKIIWIQFSSREEMIEEAKANLKPTKTPLIPADFV